MKLKDIAHSRTGDKGEISNISLIPYNEEDFEYLKKLITAEKVKKYFHEICKGEVICYEIPGIKALNFVLDKTLGGGVTRSLALDKHGKTLGMALLEMEIPNNGQTDIKAAHKTASNYKFTSRTIRIGSGAGYAGDRIDPAIELMEKGKLDYIIFECLAERTIALGQQSKSMDATQGYNSLLEERMEKILPLATKNKIKVITNMGSANPKAAANKTLEIAKRLGLFTLNIAYVNGDDVFDAIHEFDENYILENGKKLKDFSVEFVSANTYMGSGGIVEALEKGADIVITGRVSDPALTVGPLVHEFGWNVIDNPDKMGQAILAGHLLECAGQVTGGYYSEPGKKDVKGLAHLGFPIIEISEDGPFVVSKVEGSGGIVCVDTCKEQMVYEIHDPKKYMTPDAIADFSNVVFTQIGRDKVLAECATSHGKPETLKVSLGYRDCYIGEGEISYGGSGCVERAKLAADIIKTRLPILEITPDELRVDFIGYNSLYRSEISDYIGSEKHAEVRLRISGRFKNYKDAEKLANDIETLYTNGPAGGGGATKQITETLSVCSIFIPRDSVHARCHMLHMIGYPVKEMMQFDPGFAEILQTYLPQLADSTELEKLTYDLFVNDMKTLYQMSNDDYEKLLYAIMNVEQQNQKLQWKEVQEFGVKVDLKAPCHQWSNTDEATQKACVSAIEQKYNGRMGEIIFYGPSNVQMWYSLERDMLPYAAQNHGMGGCVDEEMIKYAPRMLYAFKPSVVFFQTGSNDLANGLTLNRILENKSRMYHMFLENLPDTKLVVMSGLPLPKRQQFWKDTVKVNEILKDFCEKTDRMYFMDATDALLKDSGEINMKTFDGKYFMPEYYRMDGIHLNKTGHDVWTMKIKEMLSKICFL